jgi:hypothetical protein
MEKILLDGETIFYKTPYTSILSKDELLSVIYDEIKKQPDINNEAFNLSAKASEIQDIIQFSVDKCTELAIQDNLTYNEIYTEVWANRVRAKNPAIMQKVTTEVDTAYYHVHTELNLNDKKFIPNYTFVYYVQMPDNLVDVEGALLIKNTKDNVHIYHPQENDFIILNADIPHSPMGSPNSTKDRIVIAGNVAFVNIKKEKTFL